MTKRISIEGMTCQNCATNVEEALKGISSVESVIIDLPGKFAKVELNQEVANGKIKSIIEDAGYQVVKIE